MEKPKSKLLVVDDEPINIEVLLNVLSEDYAVTVATDGIAALEKVAVSVPDLILLDILMPAMDGFEICRRLKEDPVSRDIPIIFLTALNEDADEALGLSMGAVDYISKPFNPYIVKARVRNHLELKAHREHLTSLVAEQTRKLKKAHEELLKKALEAGRAQTLAIVLHNVRNAVMPMVMQADILETDFSDKPLEYLDASYRDLAGNREDLNRYLAEDARGARVFAYMGKLLKMLREQQQMIAERIGTIQDSSRHVFEILQVESACEVNKEKGTVFLSRVVEKALSIESLSLAKRRIEVDPRLDEKAAITGDENELLQVVLNLIKNAREAMDALAGEGGKRQIIVRTFREGGTDGLEISDTGIGISKHQLPGITEVGVSHKGSSGLGLFFCKTWVEENQGVFTIESDGPGKGATVRMLFQRDGVEGSRP